MKKLILALLPLFGYLFNPTQTKQETIFESTNEDTPSYFEYCEAVDSTTIVTRNLLSSNGNESFVFDKYNYHFKQHYFEQDDSIDIQNLDLLENIKNLETDTFSPKVGLLESRIILLPGVNDYSYSTAFLVGPDIALTSFHCIANYTHAGNVSFFNNMRIYFGNEEYNYEVRVMRCYASSNPYYNDWGLLKLKEPVGNILGYYELTDDYWTVGSGSYTYGYSNPSNRYSSQSFSFLNTNGYDNNLRRQLSFIDEDRYVNSSFDSAPGMSGSPYLKHYDGDTEVDKVYAIHSFKESGEEYINRFGYRISEFLHHFVNSFLQGYTESITINPVDYGYYDGYPIHYGFAENYQNHVTSNGFEFKTRRLRTGFIQEECIVLSSIRNTINNAFIEYKFDRSVDSIDINMSYWREISHEWLTNNNGEVILKILNEEHEWTTIYNFLSEEAGLSTDRNNMKTYSIKFPRPVYGFKNENNSFVDHTSNDNRGRICIGDLTLHCPTIYMPLSGSEINYDSTFLKVPSLMAKNNCLNYAFNFGYYPNSDVEWTRAIPEELGQFIRLDKMNMFVDSEEEEDNIEIKDGKLSTDLFKMTIEHYDQYKFLSFEGKNGSTPDGISFYSKFSNYSLDCLTMLSDLKNIFFNLNELFDTPQYSIKQVDKYHKCKPGTYKIIASFKNGYLLENGDKNVQKDFHFYRQDDDGYWSHKPGITPIVRCYDVGDIRLLPIHISNNEYNLGVGYFEITPLNRITYSLD